jgi:hypothetical protein
MSAAWTYQQNENMKDRAKSSPHNEGEPGGRPRSQHFVKGKSISVELLSNHGH